MLATARGSLLGGLRLAAASRLPAGGAAAGLGGGLAALSPVSALPAAAAQQRWVGSAKWKAPGTPYNVFHPSIQEPERKVSISGRMDGPAKYIPPHFRHQQYVEALRSGEYLGEDWPYNFLGRSMWQARRYNVSYHPIPADASSSTGILFHARLNIWSVEWYEQGKQRIRWFRAQYGFERAKRNAEDFRRDLVQAGRVDNRRTEREVRQHQIQAYAAKSLFKKKFAKKDARRLGNSGTKLGPEWKTRRDYKNRGLMP